MGALRFFLTEGKQEDAADGALQSFRDSMKGRAPVTLFSRVSPYHVKALWRKSVKCLARRPRDARRVAGKYLLKHFMKKQCLQ